MKNRYEEFMKKVSSNRQQFYQQLEMQQESKSVTKQFTFQDPKELKTLMDEEIPNNMNEGRRASSVAMARNTGFQFEKAMAGSSVHRMSILGNLLPQKLTTVMASPRQEEDSGEEQEKAPALKSTTAVTLEFEVARARRTAILLEERLQLKDQQISELKEKLSKTNQQLRHEEKNNTELQATRKRNSELEEEAEKLRQRAQQLEDQIIDHEKTHNILHEKVDKAKEFAVTVGTLASEQEEKYKAKMKEMADAVTYQKQINDELSKKAAAFNRDLYIAADKIEKMEALLTEFSSRDQKYAAENKSLKAENEKKDDEIQKLKATLNEGELFKLRMIVTAKMSENEKMKEIIHTMKKDLKEMKSAKEKEENLPSSPEFGKGRKGDDPAAIKENEFLKREIEKLRSENESLKAENQQLREQTSQLDAVLKEISQKVDSSSEESHKELKNTLSMLGSLRNQTQELREENKSLKQSVFDKHKQLDALKGSLNDDAMSLASARSPINNDQDAKALKQESDTAKALIGKEKVWLKGLKAENEQPDQSRDGETRDMPDSKGTQVKQINLFGLLDNLPK